MFDERLVLDNESRANIIYDEHLVRYRLAAKLAAGKRVLDIACGSGYGSNILAEAQASEVIGVDLDVAAIAAAEKKYTLTNLKYKSGNAEKIEEADESFDLVVSFETIEHLASADKYLGELARVLKKEGIALISTPNIEVFHQKNPFHLHEFSQKEFVETLKKYFPNVLILEQSNGLASFISSGLESEINFSNSGAPLYFIAVCSQSELPKNLFTKSIASVNPAALERLRNNPAVKLVDKIYSLAVKIPGIKSFLKTFNK